MNYLYPGNVTLKFGACGCGTSKISPTAVRHELGHVMGYWHTGNANDLMSGLSVAGCATTFPREQQHARYAYSCPVGNVDPDSDAGTSTAFGARPPRVIVID